MKAGEEKHQWLSCTVVMGVREGSRALFRMKPSLNATLCPEQMPSLSVGWHVTCWSIGDRLRWYLPVSRLLSVVYVLQVTLLICGKPSQLVQCVDFVYNHIVQGKLTVEMERVDDRNIIMLVT